VSNIFDALTIANRETDEDLISLLDPQQLAEKAAEDPNKGPEGMMWLGNPRRRLAELSVRLNPSFRVLRICLLLGFVGIALVLGGGHAFHSSALTKTPYGVTFESTIRPVSDIRITADGVGTVSEMFVKVGDVVAKGQRLLRMSDAEAQLELEQAKIELAAARQNVAQLRGQLAEVNARVAVTQGRQQQVPTRQWHDSPERAQAAYDEALIEYNRVLQLYDAGVIAKQQLDASTMSLRIAKDDLDNAKNIATASESLQQDQSEQAKLQAQVTREELQLQLRQADLKYQQAQRRVDGTVVRATQDGVVAEIPVRLGERLSEGTLLVQLTQLNPLVAEVQVAAAMVDILHIGQAAFVQLPSIPPRKVQGTVRVINPLPAANMTHTVEVEFKNPSLQLLAGQPAEVTFPKP
jgi:multidrug resistance efflux pump